DRARGGDAQGAQDRPAQGPLRQARPVVRAGHRRCRGPPDLPPRRGQPRPRRCAAAAGSQRLRHPAPRHAGADQGCREASRGAPAMSAKTMSSKINATVSRARMYEVIRAPLITEKTTNGSEHSQVTFKVAADATKPEIKQAVEGLFKVKVKALTTVTVKGKAKLFKGRPGGRSDWKKAIVSLAEGQKIDVTTGL